MFEHVKPLIDTDKTGEQKNEKRKRVESLRDHDNKYEDSVYELAQQEGDFRERLAQAHVSPDMIGTLADDYSDQAMFRKEAEQERWTDKLTGMRNKNAFLEETPQLLTMEHREGKECSFLMLDFDHFKSVNDTYGHDAGDQALQKIAEIIDKTVRSSDIVYRYGGEEFVVFLPDATSAIASEIAEKIRANVEKTPFEISGESGSHTLHKTISIGYIGTDQLKKPEPFDKATTKQWVSYLIQLADKALYTAKESGRNRTSRAIIPEEQ
jgi:diguanylate cyclase (GGDEF)-like protein